MAAKKNEQHPLRIEGYGSAGEGGARLEGQAVFVKGALAGEICQVQGGQVRRLGPGDPGADAGSRPPEPRLPPVSPVWRMSAAAHDLCRGTAL